MMVTKREYQESIDRLTSVAVPGSVFVFLFLRFC